MHHFVLVAAAAAVGLAGTAPASASQLDGLTCGMVSVGNPFIEDGSVQTAVVAGGPVRTDLPTDVITVRCTIVVNADGTHGSAVGASEHTEATGIGAVAAGPEPVDYVWGGSRPVYLCTRWTINGVHHYYDAVDHAFTTSSGAACVQAISQDVPPGDLAVQTVHVVVPVGASVNQ